MPSAHIAGRNTVRRKAFGPRRGLIIGPCSVGQMASDDRGPLLYAYRPIPANPMTVAVLLPALVESFGIGPISAGPAGWQALGGPHFDPPPFPPSLLG